MSIIEITEPGRSKNLEHDHKIAVGIDFGTTNSLVAYHNWHYSVKSIINILNDGSIVIGSLLPECLLTISSIKRLLGKSTTEILEMPEQFVSRIKPFLDLSSETPKFRILDKKYSLSEIASEIFKHLIKVAEEPIGSKVEQAVVTVPAYFNDIARGQVIMAARLAGLEVLRLIAEPTAAAYAHSLHQNNSGCYLVYDFGGGTFDVSILNMQTGVFQVIATGGDNMLGGDDIDLAIATNISANNLSSNVEEILQLARMKKESKEIESFEHLILPILNKTINIATATHSSAGNIALDGIILVGGSSRIPLIRNLLNKVFNVPIIDKVDPDIAVAIGAGLQAKNLTCSDAGTLIIDVVPLSLGIELYGGVVDKIILRNSPIPLSVTKEFTTYVDKQTAIRFHVVQGEREFVEDCISLGQFELRNIPPMPAGKVRVDVTFAIDADGILSVSALEKHTQKSHAIEIKPTVGLDENKINQVLESSYQHALSDHTARLLQEAKTNANILVQSLEQAIQETPDVLEKSKMQLLRNSIDRLKTLVAQSDRDLIIQASEELKSEAEEFVSERINSAVSYLLKGKHVDNSNWS